MKPRFVPADSGEAKGGLSRVGPAMTVTTARCSWARSRNAIDKSLLARSLSNALTRSLNSGGGPSALIADRPLATVSRLAARPAVPCSGWRMLSLLSGAEHWGEQRD